MALRWAARRMAPSGRTEPLITAQWAVGRGPFGVIGDSPMTGRRCSGGEEDGNGKDSRVEQT